ncbi:TIGR03915 family putative DNA repair protein [Antarcticibacterium sp. 1MA-6-2]|uniref:TIGR03915 family putative DNA repair protein n=1 Tax=Antarcticibacterium sp. 1MA-6-2 TaxID=2908210 RepID=UPI001F2FE05D|nr:TIGR03915 family putative DNA repair protein [Antarcticibacterium sp. 1MA-6-2]UJH91047.1 TIGR03915 family putative DNA repair protein [Antarcticibacterium sp. 1MA-6-2]
MQRQSINFIYDGSFEGLLTCIFVAYEQKLQITRIYTEENAQPDFFAEIHEVITDTGKAERVHKGLESKIDSKGFQQLFYTFLSELPGVEMLIFEVAKLAFAQDTFSIKDYGNPLVLKVAQTAKMVDREKHRMEAFVRFKLTKDQIYFSLISPDFNVLPLILSHFESRYADQKWVIYDSGRNFGIFYDLEKAVYINLKDYDNHNNRSQNKGIFDDSEKEFENLWQNYFNSVNIQSRKNSRLHVQHVPKRYWKYLSEKRPLHK